MASFLDSLFGTPPAGQVAPPQQVNYSSVPTLQYDASQINPTQTSMLGGISNLGQYNIFGQNMPLAENIGAGMINDPNAMLMTGAAPTAAGMGMGAGVGAYGAGSNLLNYMNPIMQQAMDPQSQLYNYLFNQNQQQAQAVNQMSGVGGTPYGAGVVDQANQLFNMNWQNQQLNRLLSGAQGAGAVGQTGAALQAGAPGTFMGGASIPYMTDNSVPSPTSGSTGSTLRKYRDSRSPAGNNRCRSCSAPSSRPSINRSPSSGRPGRRTWDLRTSNFNRHRPRHRRAPRPGEASARWSAPASALSAALPAWRSARRSARGSVAVEVPGSAPELAGRPA